MAGGKGTRMRSAVPKLLHPICGRPMLAWPLKAASESAAGRIVVIVPPDSQYDSLIPSDALTVVQPTQDGTGGAARSASDAILGHETTLVLSGDNAAITAELLDDLLDTHLKTGAAATMVTMDLDDPSGYGRVRRFPDGSVDRVIETKKPGDATEADLAICEVNAGIYAFETARLLDALGRISSDNAQSEYYLPDVLPLMRADGHSIAAYMAPDPHLTLGINDRLDLAAAEAEARRRILERHMLAGVTVVDPASTWIDAEVEIAPDARIEPGTSLRGRTIVGSGSTVGPLSTLTDTTLGSNVSVLHSYLVECKAGDGAQIGPFAYLRPDAELASGAKAGSFVEVKNSRIGEGAKVPHLAYVGDAEIGAGSNLGAGTITANYDGFRKNRTTIGENARIGVDTMLIAPVEVGDGAYTGAGAVIKSDVPEGALAVSENEQRNIEGYAARKAAKMQEEQTP